MEVLGNIALAQSSEETAVSVWRDALDYIENMGFVSRQTDIVLKLADLRLDRNELAEVEPLIGYLIEQSDSIASVRAQARHSSLRGDVARAVERLELAQGAAGEDWTDTDTQLLTQYRAASGN